MKEDHPDLQTWIEPELEARVVAWVLGEASEFEAAELERIAVEKPELAVFKRRIEAVHGLLGTAHKPEAEPLRLSAERRQKLLEAIAEKPSEIAESAAVVAVQPGKPRSRKVRRFVYAVGSLAACAAIVAGYFAFSNGYVDVSSVARMVTRSGYSSADMRYAPTQFQVIQSQEVLYPVIDKLGLDQKWNLSKQDAYYALAKKLDLREQRGTDLIDVRVKGRDKNEAADIANSIAVEYMERRRLNDEQMITQGMRQLEEEVKKQRKVVADAAEEAARIRASRSVVDLNPEAQDAKVSDNEYLTAKNRYIQAKRVLENAENSCNTQKTEMQITSSPAKIWAKAEPSSPKVTIEIKQNEKAIDIYGSESSRTAFKMPWSGLAARPQPAATPRPAMPAAEPAVPVQQTQFAQQAAETGRRALADISKSLGGKEESGKAFGAMELDGKSDFLARREPEMQQTEGNLGMEVNRAALTAEVGAKEKSVNYVAGRELTDKSLSAEAMAPGAPAAGEFFASNKPVSQTASASSVMVSDRDQSQHMLAYAAGADAQPVERMKELPAAAEPVVEEERNGMLRERLLADNRRIQNGDTISVSGGNSYAGGTVVAGGMSNVSGVGTITNSTVRGVDDASGRTENFYANTDVAGAKTYGIAGGVGGWAGGGGDAEGLGDMPVLGQLAKDGSNTLAPDSSAVAVGSGQIAKNSDVTVDYGAPIHGMKGTNSVATTGNSVAIAGNAIDSLLFPQELPANKSYASSDSSSHLKRNLQTFATGKLVTTSGLTKTPVQADIPAVGGLFNNGAKTGTDQTEAVKEAPASAPAAEFKSRIDYGAPIIAAKPTRERSLEAITRDELSAADQAFSTFSLHVSDVSFRLAQAALAKGEMPDAESIRPEEFYNAFDYGDPAPAAGEKVGCNIEQSAHPFLQQRNLVRIAMRVPASGRGKGTPLRLTVLLDTSGSMEREDRAASVRRAMEVLASLLGPDDRITLIGFARQPHLLADQVPGNQAAKLADMVAHTPSEGGTNLEEALKLAGEQALKQRAKAAQNRIVLLTDGAANLGNAQPESLARMVEKLRQQGVAFDACGVGAEGLNDEILEALTRKGDGRYYFLNKPEDADAGFARQLAGAFRPAAQNVKVQVRFNPARVAHYRLIGFEQHRLKKEDFRNDKVDAAELAAEEAAVALYQVEVLPGGDGEMGEVSVRFRDAASSEMVERSWTLPFDAQARAFDQASPSMQLAGTAALMAEKLHGGAMANLIDLDTLAPVVNGLRGHYAPQPSVQALVTMFGQMQRMK